MQATSCLRRWLVLGVASALLSACSGASPALMGPADRSVDGPLLVSAGSSGAMTLRRLPGSGNSRAVFGGLLLCTTGGPVTIEQIRFSPASVAPYVEPVVRMVPATESRKRPQSSSWQPVTAWRGNLYGARLRQLISGDLVRDIEGLSIGAACAKPSTTSARVELLTSVSSGPEGLRVDGLQIDYRSEGDEFTVEVPWEYVFCGDSGTYEGC